MAIKPNVTPLEEEVTFEEEGLEARALITRTTKSGVITFASKAYREMTKYSKQELMNRAHNIVRDPLMPEAAFKEMWETILTKGRRWIGIVKNLRKDGKYYWVIVKIDPIDEDGNVIYEQPDKIAGFLAIRRKPSREDIQKTEEYYKSVRKAELLQKQREHKIKEWELEFLKKL